MKTDSSRSKEISALSKKNIKKYGGKNVETLVSANRELLESNSQLKESNNYSEAVFAAIHDPMLILDKDFCIKSANSSFYKKFFITKEKTERASFFELGDKQWNIPKLRQLLKKVLSKNVYFEDFEVKHAFPGKGEKVMHLNASRIIQKTSEKLILLSILDITERSALQRKTEGLNLDTIRVHAEDKRILEDAVEHRTKQLLEKNKELKSLNRRLLFQNVEKEKRAAELHIANIELAFQNNEKEKRASELGIANTELAFQNNEKEKRAVELSIANQDLTSFTYISSHDLQEPLRKIQSFADRILREEEKSLSEKGKGYFKRMMETAKRMQQLIDDLLTYSRTKSGERIFEYTDLTVLLDDVRKDFEDVIQRQKAVIKCEDPCRIRIIPFQFRQLLHNLISNSLKFSKPGIPPHITIKNKIIPGNKLKEPSLTTQKNYCHITYTDNGIGFDPQYKERIFEVFQRLHGIEEFSGTGIGLAICKRIIENHNGIITATGKSGKGAQFDIYIPVE